MDEAEIRAEIQRRRNRAIELKVRESVWSLYKSEFKYIDDRLQKEPELILPAVRETYRKTGNAQEFRVDDVQYRLVCVEGQKESGRNGRDETTTTHYTIGLGVNGSQVLEFEARTSVTYTPEEPLFDDSVGQVKAFIEGDWVTVIPDILGQMKGHARDVRRQRNAPTEAQRLQDDMKKFGLG